MNEACAAFEQLLVEERKAALRADVDALAALQEQKRALLDAVKSSPEAARHAPQLLLNAENNLRLIRQLVSCLRLSLGVEEDPTYTSRGVRSISPEGVSRGVL